MTYEVRLTDEADRDLSEAPLWYELHGSGLGYQFLDEVLRALSSIANRPLLLERFGPNTNVYLLTIMVR